MDNKIILLKHVSFIQDKHDEFARITGEKFNIFSIMNMETDEVKTHSAIIAELLNPAGSHGQGSVFLDLFVNHLKNRFNTPSNQHIKLDSFGKLVNERICERTISSDNNWAGVTGGRIDIILEDKKQICIIETKINAEDQAYQLIRYHNYAKNRDKRFYIFYLTKDGKLLSNENEYLHNDYLEDKSLAAVNVEGHNFHYENKQDYKSHLESNRDKAHIHQCLYYPISFEKDIKQWLEKCLEKTVSLPIIRETLLQYLNLINKITNQSTNNKMSEEIIASMKTNIISSFEISRNIEPLKSKLYNEFMKYLESHYRNSMEINDKSLNNQTNYGLYFTPNFPNNNSLKIEIAVLFESRNYSNLFVGVPKFNLDENSKKKISDQLRNNKFEESESWIWKYTTNKDWADDSETWKSLATGQSSKEYLEVINIINEILRVQSL